MGRSRSTCDRTVFVRQSFQRLGGPAIHRLGHRVGSRRLRPSVRLSLELLQLLPDLGLGASGDLPPDARTVRPPAGRDRTDPGAVRRIPVDRAFAVPSARSNRDMPDSTPTLALGLALLRGLQDRIWPL